MISTCLQNVLFIGIRDIYTRAHPHTAHCNLQRSRCTQRKNTLAGVTQNAKNSCSADHFFIPMTMFTMYTIGETHQWRQHIFHTFVSRIYLTSEAFTSSKNRNSQLATRVQCRICSAIIEVQRNAVADQPVGPNNTFTMPNSVSLQ